MGVQDGWFADRAAALFGVGSGWVSPLGTPRFVAPVFSSEGDDFPEQIIVSSDGISWTYQTVSDAMEQFRMAVKGTTAIIAVSEDFGTLDPIFARSLGAHPWDAVSNPDFHIGSFGLAYGASTFVCGGYDEVFDGKFLYSTDEGANWTLIDRDDDRTQCMVAFGNGIFVSLTSSNVASSPPDLINSGSPVGASIQTSADGITWGAATVPASLQNVTTTSGAAGNWVRLRYLDDGKFWVVGYEPRHLPTLGKVYFAHSTNGTTWTIVDPSVTATTTPSVYPMDIADDGAGNYVVPCRDSTVLISDDGTTWTVVDPGATTRWKSAAYGAGVFVIVGEDLFDTSYDNQVIGYSADKGATWTVIDAPIGAGTDIGSFILNFQDVSFG